MTFFPAVLVALSALQPPARLDRRSALLHTCAAATAGVLQQQPAFAISATTMTGKSKPELGMILVDEVKATKAGIAGNLVLDGGVVAAVAFESAWPLAEGGYYDMEAKSRDGSDSAFVQIAKLPRGKSLDSLPKTFFTDTILSVDGRYGAYGAPTDIKVTGDSTEGGTRRMEISFVALSPGSAEVPRRGVVRATVPPVVSATAMNTMWPLLCLASKALASLCARFQPAASPALARELAQAGGA